MRLIDADAFRRELDNHWPFTKDEQSKHGIADSAKGTVLMVLGQMPTIEPEQRWIPCSDGPPEESGEYLCTLVGAHNTGLPSECGYELPNNHGITPGWSTCEADGFKFLRDDEVLAWMPLPEPWKGEQP